MRDITKESDERTIGRYVKIIFSEYATYLVTYALYISLIIDLSAFVTIVTLFAKIN